jgi:pSer/pThr/pTyr-binding forkhead associated (FHA) protein
MSKLVCVHGMNKGDEFPLYEGKNVVGRAPESSVLLFDKKCSRNHCIIHKKGRHYSVEDLDSRNGTLLNGKRVTSKAKSAAFGDVIKIGKTVLVLSDKAVGSVVNQTASDVAAALQTDKFDKLLTDASMELVKTHDSHSRKSVWSKIRGLLNRN